MSDQFCLCAWLGCVTSQLTNARRFCSRKSSWNGWITCSHCTSSYFAFTVCLRLSASAFVGSALAIWMARAACTPRRRNASTQSARRVRLADFLNSCFTSQWNAPTRSLISLASQAVSWASVAITSAEVVPASNTLSTNSNAVRSDVGRLFFQLKKSCIYSHWAMGTLVDVSIGKSFGCIQPMSTAWVPSSHQASSSTFIFNLPISRAFLWSKRKDLKMSWKFVSSSAKV